MLGTGVGLFVVFAVVMMVLDRNQNPPHFPPTLQTVPVVFEPNELFKTEPTPKSNAAWDSLMPDGRGFVLVDNPSEYNLGPGIPTDVGPDRYSISMFHQLHCLGMIREMYFASMHGAKADVYGEESLSGAELKQQQMTHIGHCFDYLRQAVMCAGDMTLEGAMLLPNGEVGPAGVDGWGATHQCRSWEQAVEWTLQHKAPHNHTGIA
ncbi:uncharacterized protein PG986_008681 [Apiospora aurea]|uniref:Oxidase ustYa n=1 Tax=Apiospora aurea TaxID=335848 RepID=A0ABR1Q5J2_9PEZI